jgi:hypothetical protein
MTGIRLYIRNNFQIHITRTSFYGSVQSKGTGKTKTKVGFYFLKLINCFLYFSSSVGDTNGASGATKKVTMRIESHSNF